MVKSEWIAKGFADEPVENKEQLVEMILQLKREKNAVILGHYYQRSEIQDIADFVGDSLAMAQWAAKVEADVLVVCGVHFMGETAKILCPDKMVLVPDLNAGCSLADSCPADKFAESSYILCKYFSSCQGTYRCGSHLQQCSSDCRKLPSGCKAYLWP